MNRSDETPPLLREAPSLAPSSLLFPVVGLGGSAGGMEALTTLFSGLPDETGMAFVVVLHLSPVHESHADEILQRVTRLRVRQVTEPMAIEADCVYVIPPNKSLAMNDGHLHIGTLAPHQPRNVAIDQFFRTLAEVHRERAVGVVLSGTGSDGTMGLLALKAHGGVTLAQSPLDAEYEGMPQSAIAAGVVDMVLPVAEMPQKLLDLWENAQRIALPDAEQPMPLAHNSATPSAPEAAEAALHDIITLLQARTNHDFRHYKRATVLRRLERRMQVNEQPNLPAYRDYLEAHPGETPALLQDMLISVTQFFRDRGAFEALERELHRQHFAGPKPPGELRAWVPGCATGEEAYSVGMLLAGLAAEVSPRPEIHVFASDIDERAIGVARAGIYPEAIVVDVPPARLRQFFVHEGSRYRITRSLRESILFAAHNVLRDPPFSRVDLLCCRNLLIYLDRDSQARLFEMFHLAMNPGALLFLGSSESADVASSLSLFSAVDKKHRIYRANTVTRAKRSPPLFQTGAMSSLPSLSALPALPSLPSLTRAVSDGTAPPAFEELHHRLLEQYAPPSVLVDGDYNILHLSERVGRFLHWAPGPPSRNLLAAALPPIRLALRTALFHARRSGHSVEARRVRLSRNDQTCLLNMTVRPVGEERGPSDLLLVLFDELQATLADDAAPAPGDKDPLVVELEAELQRVNEQLQGSIGSSEASTEELRASNEELQAINEELRSATEELETSQEELQSVNEELVTVNAELKVKIDETAKVNDDLNNFIASTDIAILFVDAHLHIKRYTPAATKIFNLIASDVGRSLLDLTHRLDYEQLASDAAEVFASLQMVEREVHGRAGGTYLVRVLPYRTKEDRIDGALFNFIDISARRDAEAALSARAAHMQLVAESTKDFAIITADAEGLVQTWNEGANRIFGYTEDEIVNQPLALLFTNEDRARGAPEDEMRRAREDGRAEDERWHRRKDGSTFYCSGVMSLLEGKRTGYAKIARDMTYSKLVERRREAVLSGEKDLRAQLQAANARKDEFLAVMSHELKGPLNLILLKAELLMRAPEVRGVTAVESAAETIRQTVRSQAKIIDDLLDLSRVQTGKLSLNVVAVDCEAVLERVVGAIRADAEAKRLRLVVDIEIDHCHISADLVRVEQIVWNLLSNAVKFTPAGGRIDVRLAQDDGCARIDVSDSGRGIEPEVLPHVFEMFRQADARTTREHGGLGIGLALVKSLTELHGGRVEAASEGRGQGARFSCWLPLAGAVAGVAGANDGGGQLLLGRRVLLCDDDPDTLEAFAGLLELEGSRVTAVHSGAEALAAVSEGAFDLLLSDVGMPSMDGYELIAEVRKLPHGARLAAIAVTGFGRRADETRALEAGFDAHVSKPVSLEELAKVVGGVATGPRP